MGVSDLPSATCGSLSRHLWASAVPSAKRKCPFVRWLGPTGTVPLACSRCSPGIGDLWRSVWPAVLSVQDREGEAGVWAGRDGRCRQAGEGCGGRRAPPAGGRSRWLWKGDKGQAVTPDKDFGAHGHVHAWVCMRVHVCISVCMGICMCMHEYACARVSVPMCRCMHVCLALRVCTRVCAHMPAWMCMCVNVCTRVYACMLVCACIALHVCAVQPLGSVDL